MFIDFLITWGQILALFCAFMSLAAASGGITLFLLSTLTKLNNEAKGAITLFVTFIILVSSLMAFSDTYYYL